LFWQTTSVSPTSDNDILPDYTPRVSYDYAELDLKLRGPGDVYGTIQHGAALLKIASFSDFSLIEKAKKEAEKIFPKLSQYPLLLEKLKSISVQSVSPD